MEDLTIEIEDDEYEVKVEKRNGYLLFNVVDTDLQPLPVSVETANLFDGKLKNIVKSILIDYIDQTTSNRNTPG